MYIGCLTNLNGPEVMSVELLSNDGKILNLNFISAMAQNPNKINIISPVRSNLLEGIKSPVIARYIMEAICNTTRQIE